MVESNLTKYERARIIGARALQIAMNAPVLIKLSKKELEEIKYDAIKIAEIELDSNALPISVKRPMPKKNEEELKRSKETKISDKKIEEEERKEEADIAKGGEIMELANPDDEKNPEDEEKNEQ